MTDTTPLVSRLWLEGRGGPEFLATGTPALTWQVEAAPGWRQEAARVELRRAGETETEAAELPAPDSQAVTWPVPALAAHDDAEIRVTVLRAGEERNGPG